MKKNNKIIQKYLDSDLLISKFTVWETQDLYKLINWYFNPQISLDLRGEIYLSIIIVLGNLSHPSNEFLQIIDEILTGKLVLNYQMEVLFRFHAERLIVKDYKTITK